MQQSAELLPCARGAHLVHGGHDLVGCDMTRGRRLQTEVPRTGLREEARVGCRSAMQVFRTAATRIMRYRSGCRSVWDLLTIRLGNGDVFDQSVGRDCQDLDFYQEAGSVSVTGVPPRSRSHRNRSMYADCNRSHCKTQTQRWPTTDRETMFDHRLHGSIRRDCDKSRLRKHVLNL